MRPAGTLVLFLTSGVLFAQDFSVCPAGPPDCDYATIQEALDNADHGSTITIAEPGTYPENGLRRNRTDITIVSENPSARDSYIIDGGGTGPVVIMGINWTLEGVTVTGGNAALGSGGAISASGGVTLRNVVLRNNSADSGGGGFFNNSGSASTITIENCAIHDNTARFGAGVSASANLVIRNSQIFNNTASRSGAQSAFGGGVDAVGNLTIENSVIRDNQVTGSAGSGGGLRKRVGGNEVRITNTVFENNSSSDDGGAMNLSSPATITGGAISGNTAADRGGGIDFSSGRIIVVNGVAITGNTAAEGGGIYCGSALGGLSGALGNNTPDDLAGACASCSEGEQQACATGRPGLCATGTQTCGANGIWGECRFDGNAMGIPGLANAEDGAAACSDGLDNDCDGLTDQADPQCDCVSPVNKLDYALKGPSASDCDPQTTADTGNAGSEGDPVNTFSGELYNLFDPDLDLGGPLPLRFQRYYASGLSAAGLSGRLGENWRHGYEWSLTDGGTFIEIINPRGRRIRFVDDAGQWRLDGPQDVAYQLVSEPAGWVLGDPQSRLLYVFGLSRNLDIILDSNGNALALSYSGADLTSVSDVLGRMLDFTYAGGRLASVSDGTRTVSFGHDAGFTDLVSITDARSQVTTFSYQSGSLMTGMTRPRGNTPFTQTWHANGRVITQTDAELNTTGFAYATPAPGDTTLSDPPAEGTSRVHQHADWGGLTEITDRAGQTVTIGNDGDGRRGGLIDREGEVTQLEYDPVSGDISRHVRADGSEIRTGFFSYEVRGIQFRLPSTVTYPDGRFVLREYDAVGNLVSITDAAGQRWSFTRNSQGQVLTITNPSGGVITQTFNADGTLASRQDPAGNLTQFGYDGLRRMNLVTFADNSVQSITWDAADRPLTVTDPRGNATTFGYDANSNLATVTNRRGEVTTLGYDGRDRLVSVLYDDGVTLALAYDARNRVASATDGSGRQTLLDYDARGRLIQITDAGGAATMLAYDNEGALVSATDAGGNTVSLNRGLLGRLTGLVDGLGNTGTLEYDAAGRIATLTTPEGLAVSREYDANGRVAATTRDGATIRRTYDPLGRPATLVDPAGNPTSALYDSQGRLTSSTDRLGNTTALTYDNRGRVAGATFPGALGSASYSYDANGNLTTASYSDGTTVTAQYDEANRLVAGTELSLDFDAHGRVIASNGLAMTRDGAGRITAITWPDGFRADYSYDPAGRLSGISDTVGNSMSYGYDDAGRVAQINRSNGIQTDYTWDAAGRMTSWRHGAATGNKIISVEAARNMRYDADGRLVFADGTPLIIPDPTAIQTADKTYNAGDQLTLKTWDPLGRAVSAGDETFEWTLRNELEAYSSSARTVSFGYDGFGYPRSQLDQGIETQLGWNHGTAEASLNLEMRFLQVIARHVPTPGGEPAYSALDSDMVRFPIFDEQGHLIGITDAGGQPTYRAAYSALGQVIAEEGLRDLPFGAWAASGRIQLTDDVVFGGPGDYYHSGAGTRIAPVVESGDLSTNPYALTATGNPVDTRGAADLSGATHAVMNPIGSLLDGLNEFTNSLGEAVGNAGKQAVDGAAADSAQQFEMGPGLPKHLMLDQPVTPRNQCDAPSRQSQEKLDRLEQARKAKKAAAEEEALRRKLKADIKALEQRLDEIRDTARKTGEQLEEPSPYIPLLPEESFLELIFGAFVGANGFGTAQQRELSELQRQYEDAASELNDKRLQLKDLDSVIDDLGKIVTQC